MGPHFFSVFLVTENHSCLVRTSGLLSGYFRSHSRFRS